MTAEQVENFIKQHDLRMTCWFHKDPDEEGPGQWHCWLRERGILQEADGWDVQRSGNTILEAQAAAVNAYAKLAVHH